MITEQKKAEIEKEAREILEKFGKSLDKVKFKQKDLKETIGGFREEGSGEKGNPEFRKRMFENAQEKDEDFIIAEKKKW